MPAREMKSGLRRERFQTAKRAGETEQKSAPLVPTRHYGVRTGPFAGDFQHRRGAICAAAGSSA